MPLIRLRLYLLTLLAALFAASSPVDAQSARWRSVSVGDDHACALDSAGGAYCWGYNHAGQLGASTPVHCGIVGESGHRGCYPTASDTRPLPAAGGMRFATLIAGRYVTCGLTARGRGFCWGAAMGDTSAYRDRCLEKRPCSFAPVPLAAGRALAAVDAGARCYVPRGGAAECWDDHGPYPAPPRDPWAGRAMTTVAGDPESGTLCGLDRAGAAWCLGKAVFGVVGSGSRDSAAAGPAAGGFAFTSLAVLGTWICATDRGGAARCWGAAGYGDASAGEERAGLEKCERWATLTWCNSRPAPVAGNWHFRSVTAMPRGTMPVSAEMVGLTAAGEAFVWGGDRVPRPWHPERRWASVSAGDWGQCGVTTGGELFCWGRNPHDAVQGRIAHPR